MKKDSSRNDISPGSRDDNGKEDRKAAQFLMNDDYSNSSSSCTWCEKQVRDALQQKMSPATQTLHQLSQTVDQLDLLCNNDNKTAADSPARNMCPAEFSQYEFSVAEILATAANKSNNNDEKKKDHDIELRKEETSKNDNKEESSLVSETSPAPTKTKNTRRAKTKEIKRTAVSRTKPSRVKPNTNNNRPSQRNAPAITKSKKRPTTQSSPLKASQHGSYRSQAVEKWRGNRLVKVYQSMRQAADAAGTHHGYIKRLIQTGAITNGFVWKLQQQTSVASVSKAKTEAKSNQEETSRAARRKGETPPAQSSRATRSNASEQSAASIKLPIRKKTVVKHPSPVRRRPKSVQRLKNDGSVSATFPSMLQASVVTGISRGAIRDCVKNSKMKDPKGFAWRLMEMVDTSPADSKNKMASNKKERKHRSAAEEKKDSMRQIPSPSEEKAIDGSKDEQIPPFASVIDKNKSKEGQDNEEPQFHVAFADISSTGKLGLMIRSMLIDDKALVAVERFTFMGVPAFAKGCIVESVKVGSHCEQVGIRPGDNLFLVKQMDGRRVLDGSYDMILEAARSDERPIKLCVARPIVKKLISITKPKGELLKARPKEATKKDENEHCLVGSVSKKISPKIQPKVEPPRAQPEVNNSAPFCVLCREGATKHEVHHAWCEQNPQFQKSGAHEVLRRITEGMKLGCNVCEMEFRTGRIQQNLVHTLSCKENQKVIFDVEDVPQQVQVKSKVKRKEKKPESSQPTKATSMEQRMNEPILTTKRGRSVKVSAKILTSEAHLSDIGRDGSDASDELEPERKKRPVSSLFCAKRSPMINKVIDKPNSSQNRKSETKSRRDAPNVSRQNRTIPSKGTVATTITGNKQYVFFAADYSSESDAEYDGSGELEITWEPCPDPWGEEGFVDGDVVVFSKQSGVGNVETTLPSPRFSIDPLAGSCRYKKTHHMPNEGFHALLLQRDTQSALSWGFSVHRHEFGGACLVSSVEPMSPAHAAFFVGAHAEDRSYAALRKNDMIMTIDGKEVGGMTVEAFQLALELAGSELILVVSRYKGLSDESTTQEREFLSNVDIHINDPSRLHWADIGGGSTSAFHNYRNIQRTALNYQSSPESHVSVHSKPSPLDSASYKNEKKKISGVNQRENQNLSRPEPNVSTEKIQPLSSKTHSESHGPVPSIKKVRNITEHKDAPIRRDEETSESSSALSSVEPTDLRSVLEADEASSNSDEFGEDGNAWCGCVCGKEHSAKGNYFWVQCEACCSWFNVYEQCVGFGKKEAETMEEWTCWACGGEDKSPESGDQLPTQQKRESPKQRKEKISKQRISKKAPSDETTGSTKSTDSELASLQVHKIGSLVYIQEHAWSGVNNPEGIARVTAVHKDEEDGQTYDVKYIVGRSSKGVFARYITPHTFD